MRRNRSNCASVCVHNEINNSLKILLKIKKNYLTLYFKSVIMYRLSIEAVLFSVENASRLTTA